MSMVVAARVLRRPRGRRHGCAGRPRSTPSDAGHDIRDTLSFVPSIGSGFFLSFLVLLSLNWWASWYPGAEPGGGGYIAQRIFSAKNEKPTARSDAVVQHRPLCAAAVALDRHRAGCAGAAAQPDRGAGRLRGRLRLGDDPLPAAVAARADAGWVCGGLHVHHRDAPQPGRVLPDQRPVQALPRQARYRAPLRGGFARRHHLRRAALRRSDRLHADPRRLHRRRLEVPAGAGRGSGAGVHAALVLVAHQCLERDYRYDCGGDHLADPGEQSWACLWCARCTASIRRLRSRR